MNYTRIGEGIIAEAFGKSNHFLSTGNGQNP